MKDGKDSYFKLFYTFARIGAVTFGGGYAMLPILQKEIVENNGWCTEEDLLDYFAVGQCTPGIIAVNTATFIGYKVRGVLGGIIATLGMVFPSLVIISVIFNALEFFKSNMYVQYALAGIQVAVAALITSSVFKLGKKSVVDIPTALIAVLAFVLMLVFDLSPILMIIMGLVLGLSVSYIKLKSHKEDK